MANLRTIGFGSLILPVDKFVAPTVQFEGVLRECPRSFASALFRSASRLKKIVRGSPSSVVSRFTAFKTKSRFGPVIVSLLSHQKLIVPSFLASRHAAVSVPCHYSGEHGGPPLQTARFENKLPTVIGERTSGVRIRVCPQLRTAVLTDRRKSMTGRTSLHWIRVCLV